MACVSLRRPLPQRSTKKSVSGYCVQNQHQQQTISGYQHGHITNTIKACRPYSILGMVCIFGFLVMSPRLFTEPLLSTPNGLTTILLAWRLRCQGAVQHPHALLQRQQSLLIHPTFTPFRRQKRVAAAQGFSATWGDHMTSN